MKQISLESAYNRTFIILAIVCFFACSDSRYKSAENVAELSISFIDQNWDSKNVPTSGPCRSCDGERLSPALLVKNIPENTDVLIVEFEDKTVNFSSKPEISRSNFLVDLKVQSTTQPQNGRALHIVFSLFETS